MTVIAWDGKTLAADKQSTFGAARVATTKIRRLSNGSLFGAAGTSSMCREMARWIEDGGNVSDFPEAQRSGDTNADCIVIDAAGKCWVYQTSPMPISIESRHMAFGSGSDFALAAMHLGLSASKAVKVAIELCPTCGIGVDTLKI